MDLFEKWVEDFLDDYSEANVSQMVLDKYKELKLKSLKSAYEEISKTHVFKMDLTFRNGVQSMYDAIVKYKGDK